jgi:hypothetical protein
MGFDSKAFFLAGFFIKVSKLIFFERGRTTKRGFTQSYPQKLWTDLHRDFPACEINSAIIFIRYIAHAECLRETLSAVHHTSRRLAHLAIDRLFHHRRGLGH